FSRAFVHRRQRIEASQRQIQRGSSNVPLEWRNVRERPNRKYRDHHRDVAGAIDGDTRRALLKLKATSPNVARQSPEARWHVSRIRAVTPTACSTHRQTSWDRLATASYGLLAPSPCTCGCAG